MRRLVLNLGSSSAREFVLEIGTHTFGRNATNEFQIEDPSISGTHCHFILDENDELLIEDLGSTNGSFVEDVPVKKAVVRVGQRIRLGNVELMVADEELDANAEPLIAAPAAHAFARSAEMTSVSLTEGGTTIVAAGERIFCKNHYKNPGRYACPKCHKYFCDLCVNTRGASSGGAKFCKLCGTECSVISVQAHVPKVVNFFKAVPQAFRYPFRGDGLILLIGGTFFFGFLDLANYISRHSLAYGMRAMMMRVTIFTFILGVGYLFSFLKNVIYASAEGDEQMPDWPELSEWKADIVSPMFQLVVTATLCFAPALTLHLWFEGDYPWLTGIFALAGCCYFPMAFLGVAMFDSLTALNPLFVVGSILKVPREYALVATGFALLVTLRGLCETALVRTFPIPLAPALVSDLLVLWLLIVMARVLGVLYRSQKDNLGWFSHKGALSYRQAAQHSSTK